jgi:ABC-2 type transport system ATP-binding protein
MHALEIYDLHKTYRNGFQALKGVDLIVEEGDFFALLGPNGAGKSTCIGVVSSLVNKTSGSVKVFGHSIDNDLINANLTSILLNQSMKSLLTRVVFMVFREKKPLN